jgi:DNA-binding SARP family transcriptional activator
MQLRLLGTFEAMVGDRQVNMGRRRERCLLAVLLLEPGRVVPVDRLIDLLWDGEPPEHARRALHSHVARLRTMLRQAEPYGAPVMVTTGAGYLIETDPDAVDVHRFRSLVAQARSMPDAGPRAALLREALDLWRGPALADIATPRLRHRLCQDLEEARSTAVEDWLAAELELGHHRERLADLSRLVAEHPLRQRLAAMHMLALHHAGRTPEALRAYLAVRTRLVEEEGLEPGPDLTAAHAAILRSTEVRGELPTVVSVPEPIVSQLPPDLADYTGYDLELADARAVLTRTDGAGAVVPVVISGQGGVGKTTFAVHLAHMLRLNFPDGQLFIGLGGGQPNPVAPGEALGRALRALGVADAQTLRDLDERISQYRSILQQRRVLVVLDDAASADQVRPFLSSGHGSAVIVTTRARLTTLPGARRIDLDVMSEQAAMALLARIVGDVRTEAEPDVAGRLIAMCARLPLALRIAGARLAARPHWPISRLVDRMSDERRRLDELAVDDLEVRASVAVSYHALDTEAQRAFRLLGHLDPPDFGVWTVAALLDVATGSAEDVAERLVDARLVEVVEAGHTEVRYRMHDLVRLFARECAAGEDAQSALRAAVTRVLATTLHLVERMSAPLPLAVPRLYCPELPPVRVDLLPPPAGPVGVERWFDVEEPALIAMVERAATLGLDQLACALADGLVFASFGLRNQFDGWNRAHAAALAAARAAGNHAAEAVIECGIGQLRYKEDRFVEAKRHFRTSLAHFRRAGDARGRAAARNGLGTVCRELGQHRVALPLLQEARRELERLGDHEGAAHALYGIGYGHRELGEDTLALRYLDAALSRYRRVGHRRGEAIAIRGIGLVYRARGELDVAAEHCTLAHRIVQDIGDRLLLCYTAQALAKVWIRQGDPERAHEPLLSSLRTCTELHDRLGAALVRRTLGELHLAADRLPLALAELELAKTAWEELAHALWRARTLRDIGAAHARAGDCAAAHDAWRTALATFRHLGTREAAELPAWRHRWGCRCDPLLLEVGLPSGVADLAVGIEN